MFTLAFVTLRGTRVCVFINVDQAPKWRDPKVQSHIHSKRKKNRQPTNVIRRRKSDRDVYTRGWTLRQNIQAKVNKTVKIKKTKILQVDK